MTKKIKSSLLILLIVVQLVGVTPVNGATNLTDIKGHWAESQIQALVEQATINGYPDNTFKPSNAISRAEFITVITKALNIKPMQQGDFTDTVSHWARTYIGGALDYGLIDSEDYYVAENTYNFLPDQGITRGEMAEIIVKALGQDYAARTYTGTLDNFVDNASIETELLGYVSQASSLGIINGYPDGSFGPHKSATRAEACVMLIRMQDQLVIKSDQAVVDSEDIYATYANNVVKIYNYDGSNNLLGTGSGFVIDLDGKIATNYHVIDGATRLEVEFTDGTVMDVLEVTNYDMSKDVAVIYVGTISNGAQAVVFGNDRALRTGSAIYTIGYPLGESLSITNGLISSKYRDVYDEYYIQISAPISPGNSGGPLVNKYGEVVGINTLSTTSYAQNMNYSSPISFIGEVLTEDNTVSMAYFANRDTDIMTAHHVVAVVDGVYGIDKTTGEKVYTSDNHFDLEQVGSYGVTLYLAHDQVGGDNALNLDLYMYDGDYDWYDYNSYTVSLSDANITVIDLAYTGYYNEAILSGKYFTEVYMSESSWVTTELSFTDHSGFGEYNLSKSDLIVFDPAKYSDTGRAIAEGKFNGATTTYIGVSHELTFRETFEDYHGFLVMYELIYPDGTREIIYDTVFGVPDEKTGLNTFSYGTEFVGSFPAGTYQLNAFVEDTLVDETSFEVDNRQADAPPAQITDLVYYDSEGKTYEAFNFSSYMGLELTLEFDEIDADTLVEVGYTIRTEEETPADARDEMVTEYVYASTNKSMESTKVIFDALHLPSRILEDYPVGLALVLDVYYGGLVIASYDFYDAFNYEIRPAIADLKVMVGPYSHDDWSGISNESKLEAVKAIEASEVSTFSLTELEGNHMAYKLELEGPSGDEDMILTKGLSIELVNKESNEVVAASKEVEVMWYARSQGYYLDSLGILEGMSIEVGAYDLQVYYGQERLLIYEKPLMIIE